MQDALHMRLAQARALEAQGQWQAAADICFGVLREAPNCAAAMYRLGDLYANPECPQRNTGKAVYWFYSGWQSPEEYTDAETGMDCLDRLGGIFRAECCKPPYAFEQTEEGFRKAVALMRAAWPSNRIYDDVWKLFDWMAGDLFSRCSEDTYTQEDNDAANLMSWISTAERPPDMRPVFVGNNFFEEDDDFPYCADIKNREDGPCPDPGDTQIVIQGSLRDRPSTLEPHLMRLAWGPLSELRIIEFWADAMEEVLPSHLKLTGQVLRVRRLEDLTENHGPRPILCNQLHLPSFSDPCIWDLVYSKNGVMQYRWRSQRNVSPDFSISESHWNEAGTIILCTDSDGITHQVATTCVWDSWMCLGDRPLSPEALRVLQPSK